MRIVEVTLSTPTAENYRGATALGYHIAKYRSSGIELHIFTLNYNGVSAERIAAIAGMLTTYGLNACLLKKELFVLQLL